MSAEEADECEKISRIPCDFKTRKYLGITLRCEDKCTLALQKTAREIREYASSLIAIFPYTKGLRL